MRLPVRSLTPFALLGLVLAAPDSAAACSCVADFGADQPCEAYWGGPGDAVFVGRAVSVSEIAGAYLEPGLSMRYRFEVIEAFYGVEGPTADVVTGRGGGDCGYEFKIGESYFLYAGSYREGAFTASTCGPTKHLAHAGGDVEYARQIARGEARTGLYGRVLHVERESMEDYSSSEGLEGIVITVEGPGGQRYSAQTGELGDFAIVGKLEGSYTVHAALPKSLPPAEPQQIEVQTGRCTGVEIKAGALATLRGRVVTAEGLPAENLQIILYPGSSGTTPDLSEEGTWASADEEGRFVYDELPAGDYFLVVNPEGLVTGHDLPYPTIWYPGTGDAANASRITLRPTEVRAIDFQLPPTLGKRAVQGAADQGRAGASPRELTQPLP